MSTNTIQKLQHELNSLQGLSIINLVCGALAMAFGVSFLIPNIISMVTTQIIEISQVGLVILGGVTFAVAIRWLISCAEIIDSTSDISENLSEHKKNQTLTDEAMTGLIVNMTATYRENKPTLKLMTTISKIAGICFIISALFTVNTLVSGILSGAEIWTTLLSAISIAINLAVAFACFIIPHFFKKYSTVWDNRLDKAAKAEEELKKQFEAA